MRNLKLMLIIFATSLFSSNSNAQNKMTQTENAKQFVSKFTEFKMDIQGAGMATIPSATISKDNSLLIDYAYNSEGEKRKGSMKLDFVEKSKRFEGHWETKADNGNVYNGTLYFVFKEIGEAEGYYKYAGSDYKITIFVPTKK